MSACPVLIVWAERSRFSPRIGRSLALSLLWSDSIGLDPVVLPPGVDVAGLGQQLVEEPRVDRRLVSGDLDRPAAVGQGLAEEAAGGELVAPFAGEYIDDLSVLVDGAIQVAHLPAILMSVSSMNHLLPGR